MAKNRKNITRDFLGNGRRIQLVLNAPQFIKVPYISPKGLRLLAETTLTGKKLVAYKKLIQSKYGKNRIYPNPACTEVVKIITHSTVQGE